MVMLSCRYHKLSTCGLRGLGGLTCVNSSASQRAISSDASGWAIVSYGVGVQRPLGTYAVLIGIKEHEQRLQHHLDSVDIFGVLRQASYKPAEGPRGD